MNDDMAKKESWTPLLKSYPKSRKINAVSIGAETLYTRLLAQCDDYSNYNGTPALILGELFARRKLQRQVTLAMVKKWVQELWDAGLIGFYEADKERYIHVLNCKKMLRADIKETIDYPEVNDTLSIRNRNDIGPSPSSSPSYTSSPTPARPKARPDDYPEDFRAFWKRYPRKANKRMAFTKWGARLKEGKTAEFFMACLEAYIRNIELEDTPLRFIQHPTTFLNGGYENHYAPAEEGGVEVALAFFGKAASPQVRRDLEKYAQTKSDAAWKTVQSHLNAAPHQGVTVDAKAVREALS